MKATWSLKVSNFGTNQKPVCNFLFVISYLALFPSYHSIDGQTITFDKELPLFNSLIRDEPLNCGLQALASKN